MKSTMSAARRRASGDQTTFNSKTDSCPEFCHRRLVRNPLAAFELRPRLPDIPDHLQLLDKGFVVLDIENDRSTFPVLSKNERSLRLADTFQEAGSIRPEGDRG